MFTASFHKFNKIPLNSMSAPNPFYCYPSRKQGLAYLKKALDEYQGLVVLTGVQGSGKSMLLHEFMSGLDQSGIKVVHIVGGQLTADKLLKNIASQLDIVESLPSEDTLFAGIITYFYNQHISGMRVIVSIDDAHNLSADCLNVLIKLASYKYDNKSLVFVIAVGSELLRSRLKDEAYYKLELLTASETASYIVHKLASAAGDMDRSVSSQALGLIYQYSQGIPQFVSILCDSLLSKLKSDSASHIDSDDIESVVHELRRETGNDWLLATICHDERPPAAPVVKLVSGVDSEVSSHKTSTSDKTGLLGDVEMLLAFMAKLDVSRWAKHNRVKVSEYTLALQRQLKNFKALDNDKTRGSLVSSAQCLYDALIASSTRRERLDEKGYQTIMNNSFSASSAGTVRVIKTENACKILELASRSMTCIQLGVFAHKDKLESVFKELSDYGPKLVAGKCAVEASSVLMWRVTVSENIMLYLVGIPINDTVNSDEYLPLMGRLDAATVISSKSEDPTAEEKHLLFKALVFYGAENTRLVMYDDKPDGRKDTAYFFFQGAVAIPRVYLDSDEKSIVPVVLFQNNSFTRDEK